MTYALIATCAAAGGVNGATTGNANMTGANLLVMPCNSYKDATEPTYSDSEGNTYTALTTYTGGVFLRTRFRYSANPTVSSSMNATATGTGSYSSIILMGFSGAHATPFDQQNGGTATSSTTQASGSITPTEDNELIVTMAAHGSATSDITSVDSSVTITANLNYGSGQNFSTACGYKIQTTAAAINATWTRGNNSDDFTAVIASFKAAAEAGGQPFRKRWGGVPHNGYTRRGVW